jgi:UPF0271 protein
MFIDLNCDMAEGLANDALLMPYISSANIACGFHAGDEEIMKRTVALATAHNVSIGAHPGFADRKNFGRTEMNLSPQEIQDLIATQVSLLKKIADGFGASVRHIKPHGALYNMSAKDGELAATIAKIIHGIDPSLLLFGLSGSHSISEANKTGLQTISEVFADRTYQNDGSLTPRTQSNALIQTEEASIQQVLQMINTKSVTSVQGETVPIVAETVCLHGDGLHAVAFAKKITQTLQINKIGIKSF